MALVLGALLCFASGLLLVRLGWRGSRAAGGSLSTDSLFQSSLSVGHGLGIFSVVYFLSRLAGLVHLLIIDMAVFTALLIATLALRDRPPVDSLKLPPRNSAAPAWFIRILTAAFCIALAAALYASIMGMLNHPHGAGMDAFAIWNLHARFLFLGDPYWRDGFTSLIEWSHPDYPLLLPAAVAHFWTILGRDEPAVPALISFLFTFSTVGLLVSSLNLLHDRVTGMLGGIALLTTPLFIEMGTWQYADVPLSFFFLAVVALLCLCGEEGRRAGSPRPAKMLALAGAAAGFAAWTKNEGLLFFCSIIAARFLIGLRIPIGATREMRLAKRFPLKPLLVGAAPMLLVIIYFKRAVAPASDLFSDPATILHRLSMPSRYWVVVQWFASDAVLFGRWLFPTPLVILAYYVGIRRQRKNPGQIKPQICNSDLCWLAILLTLAGYSVIYLITPYEIYWHLSVSLDRLFLQLWPSMIFLIFHRVPIVWGERPDHQTT